MYFQLCTVTAYNLADSTVLPEEYALRAKELSYQGIGIGDNNLYAFPSFADACEKNGLKPIFGYHIKINGSKTFPFDGYLYIKNEEGYLNLCSLLKNRQESYDISVLSSFKQGLELVLETSSDFFSSPFLTAISPDLLQLKKIFGDDFYLGIALYSALDKEEVTALYQYCHDFSYQTIAFPKCLYLKKTDAYKTNLLKVALAKGKAEELENEGPYFLLSQKSLESLYRNEDLLMTQAFAEKINFVFFQKRGSLISLPNKDKVLEEKAINGLKEKLNVTTLPEKYEERIRYELKVIKEMKFSSYFLLVDDYVRFAKNADIKVGPGRGSAGGSLVAYGLNITSIDPLVFDLTFERFLNPNRKTMPDIDIDFEDERRNEVVSYLKNHYGEDKVSDIVTFVKLKPRSCLNLIGPALNFNESRLKRLTQSIDPSSDDFKDAIKKQRNNEFSKLYEDPYYKEICDLADSLINIPINTSIHAAGIILSDKPIQDYCPRKNGTSGTVLFEYPYMERMGFLKVDILALSNLSFIKNIEQKIQANHKPLPDIYADLNNPKVYQVLSQKDLVDIFQLDTSYGMKDTIDKIQPNSFNDIAACIALFRPGPMAYIDVYARRKHGQEKIVYQDSRLKPILEETYGIFVYQEQIIKAVTALADFSLGEADLFRRAISKKDLSKMLPYKERFISGCAKKNIATNTAEQIFADIEKFAEYGFNKSHAFEYSLLTYTLLYYKTFYPEEFYLTALEDTSFSAPKSNDIIKELKERNYKVKNPHINFSLGNNYLIKDKNFFLPLRSVNNINPKVIDAILQERTAKPFSSFYEFVLRMDGKIDQSGYKTLESLIDAGAFDSFSKSRLAMKNNLDNYFGFAHFSLPEDQISPLSDDGEDIGEMLYLEKMAIGKVLSCRFYNVFTKKDYQTYLVSDTSLWEMMNQLTVESETRSYRIHLNKKYDISKYDFIMIPGYLSFKKKVLEVEDLILCKRKVVKHG